MREMKDSGVPWIGEIPKEWNLLRTKNGYYSTKTIAGEQAENYKRLALTLSGVILRSKEDATGLQPESFNGYQVLREGELVFKLIDLENLATSRIGYSPYTGIVSPAYVILHPKERVNAQFGEYFFLSLWHRAIFNSLGDNGVRSNLNASDLLNIPYVFPPEEEQVKIVAFLAAKCAEIDGLVKNAQASIEEYKKLKQSVITEAVTKGIRGERPMKESGVEWIGEIPTEWSLVRLRFLSQIYTGNQDTQDNNPDGEFPFYVRSPFVERSNRWTFEGPAILMAGDGAGAGRVFHYVEGKYGCHQRVYSIQSIHGVSRRVLFYYLQELFYIMIETANSKSTVDSVRLDMLKDFPICIAPAAEQQEIAAYLDEKCAAIDSLIASKEALITELEAYKKSLIYEYVTGKKEVPA